MSLLVPIIGMGAAALLFAKRADDISKAKLEADSHKAGSQAERPIEGRWQPFSTVSQNRTLTAADVKDVRKTTDVRGVPVFLVTYSGGARVQQYFDPFEAEIR